MARKKGVPGKPRDVSYSKLKRARVLAKSELERRLFVERYMKPVKVHAIDPIGQRFMRSVYTLSPSRPFRVHDGLESNRFIIEIARPLPVEKVVHAIEELIMSLLEGSD